MEIKLKAYFCLFASLLIGSFTPVLLVLTRNTNAFELFLIAELISIPIGLALVSKTGKMDSLKGLLNDRKKLFYVFIVALLIYIPFEYGIAYAEHFISASLAIVLFRLNPLLMLLFLPVLLKERLSRRQVAALLIAFLGILMGVGQGIVPSVVGGPNLPIMLFVVVLALGYALANVIIKWQMIDNDVFISASAFILAAFFAGALAVTGFHLAPMNATDIFIIIWLGITNIFSFWMFLYSFKVLKTTIVTNTYLLSPFFTFVWAYALFGEAIQIYYIAIAVLVSLGIVIQRNDKKGGSYASRNASSQHFVIFDVTGAFSRTNTEPIKGIINSGGRVLATKFHSSNFEDARQTIYSPKFANVYTGDEKSLAQEAGFVKDVLGAKADDVVVIKAGPTHEGEVFFEELNKTILRGSSE